MTFNEALQDALRRRTGLRYIWVDLDLVRIQGVSHYKVEVYDEYGEHVANHHVRWYNGDTTEMAANRVMKVLDREAALQLGETLE